MKTTKEQKLDEVVENFTKNLVGFLTVHFTNSKLPNVEPLNKSKVELCYLNK